MKVKPTNLLLPLPSSPPLTPLVISLMFFMALIIIPFSTPLFIDDDDFVSRRCREAASGDPNFSYEFCVQCLETSNPNIHNVTTMEELVGVSMNLTARNATRIIKRISRMLSRHRSNMDPYCRRALGDCYELYADAKGELADAAKDVFEYRDYFKANIEVSAAMDSSSSTCEDGFREKRNGGEVGHPLSKENEVFFRLTAMLLAFINMLHYH